MNKPEVADNYSKLQKEVAAAIKSLIDDCKLGQLLIKLNDDRNK